MPLFRRSARPGAAAPVPLGLPRPDGTGWPPQVRRGFASSTVHELGQRAAFEVEAHAVADALVEQVLPVVPVDVPAVDAPHLAKLLLSAARTGAGLAIAERGQAGTPDGTVGPEVAAALWEARTRLPALPPDREPLAAFALLAGFWVARQGPGAVERLRDALRS